MVPLSVTACDAIGRQQTYQSVPDEFLLSDLQRRIKATTSICQSFHVADEAPPPDGLSLWLVRRCGILCQATCEIVWCWQRHIQTTFENVYVRFVLAHTAH